MPEYRNCYVTRDNHIAAAPIRFCAKMILLQSSMLRVSTTAIPTSCGKLDD